MLLTLLLAGVLTCVTADNKVFTNGHVEVVEVPYVGDKRYHLDITIQHVYVGDCENVGRMEADSRHALLLEENVSKPAVPSTRLEMELPYSGNPGTVAITCIVLKQPSYAAKNGGWRIANGGIGTNKVLLQLHSFPGFGLDMHARVYGIHKN